jgi:parallel beta-helix repeat protein
LKNVTVKNGDGDGIRVGGTCEVNDCTVQNNGGVGIKIGLNDSSTWSGGLVKKCTIKDNDGNGILIDNDQSGVDVRQNTIVHNSGAGVRVKSDGCSIRDNTIQKTTAGSQGGNGVLVDSSANRVTLRSNKFSGNSGNGIVIQGDDCYVFLNTATDSDGYIDSGSHNSGRDNKTNGTDDF